MDIAHSTFANNVSQVGGAYLGTATAAPAASTANVMNSIFWNNTTVDTSSRSFHGLSATTTVFVASSSLRNPAFADNEKGAGTFTDLGGNISGDPQFVNLALGDLQLQAGSPCIDAGAPAALSVDFDGNARPQGAGFDMGAYETAATRPQARQPQTTVVTAPIATVYPNPTTGAFTLSFDREVTGFVQVFDVQGRLVASKQLNGTNQAPFDLGTMATGMYLLRIMDAETVITKQIVVARP